MLAETVNIACITQRIQVKELATLFIAIGVVVETLLHPAVGAKLTQKREATPHAKVVYSPGSTRRGFPEIAYSGIFTGKEAMPPVILTDCYLDPLFVP